MTAPSIGLCFDRSFPAAEVAPLARAIEAAGGDELWLVEDCFYTAGISLAASALAVTDRLGVGLGILPAVARNPAITAMEIATLSNLAPGRVTAGIGHGVQEWMHQMGAGTPSPLTTLEEVIAVVRRLLRGERVSFDGREVHLRDVELDQPPSIVPPVLAGVQGPKSLALAGRVADGLILSETTGPRAVTAALEQAGRPEPFAVACFALVAVAAERRDAYAEAAPFVAGAIRERRRSLTSLPFFAEMSALVDDGGHAALVSMPDDWWREIGAIGTIDDAIGHVDALGAAGVGQVGLFVGENLTAVRPLVATVATIKQALG
jgi:alkanesulfonate monooxygenase SsuD/methylene tetrahydromethanopterin reductase-like flavin-dependent oxidoreductase (luciferase family)